MWTDSKDKGQVKRVYKDPTLTFFIDTYIRDSLLCPHCVGYNLLTIKERNKWFSTVCKRCGKKFNYYYKGRGTEAELWTTILENPNKDGVFPSITSYPPPAGG